MWIRAQFQVLVVPPVYMASPFRRKSKERGTLKKDDDQDLEEVVEAEEPLEENVAEVLESLDLDKALFESAKRVTHTCMDIRRGENVLIVCDPTTGEIGQALHRSATGRAAVSSRRGDGNSGDGRGGPLDDDELLLLRQKHVAKTIVSLL